MINIHFVEQARLQNERKQSMLTSGN